MNEKTGSTIDGKHIDISCPNCNQSNTFEIGTNPLVKDGLKLSPVKTDNQNDLSNYDNAKRFAEEMKSGTMSGQQKISPSISYVVEPSGFRLEQGVSENRPVTNLTIDKDKHDVFIKETENRIVIALFDKK